MGATRWDAFTGGNKRSALCSVHWTNEAVIYVFACWPALVGPRWLVLNRSRVSSSLCGSGTSGIAGENFLENHWMIWLRAKLSSVSFYFFVVFVDQVSSFLVSPLFVDYSRFLLPAIDFLTRLFLFFYVTIFFLPPWPLMISFGSEVRQQIIPEPKM